jgi:glycosyltransferase involved in cell wall biosynthesis
MKVAVIIPALNEAGNIGSLVKEILVQPVDQVIVVDNCSTDGTGAEAAAAGARVIVQPRSGYGYACAAGAAAADDADALVFIDGDASFLPSEMSQLLAPISDGRADLVLGSRVLGSIEPGSMPPAQAFGNALTAALMRGLYRLPVTDLGPYRAIRRSLLLSLDMQEMTFGWPTEMMVKAARRRAKVLEVPVSYRARRVGESKVSGTVTGSLRAGYRILSVTFRHAFQILDK